MKLTRTEIDFLKPRKEGRIGVDMHYHTVYSDGRARVDDVLKVCAKKGCGVAITDHNEIRGAVEACRQKTVFVVPGIEIRTSRCIDLLAYFYDIKELEEFYEKYVKNNEKKNLIYQLHKLSLKDEELIDALKNYNTLISLAHPFFPATGGRWLYRRNNELFDKVDAIEVLNAKAMKFMNKKAEIWRKASEKAGTVGTDGHTLGALGRALTVANAETVDEFLDEVKNKKAEGIGKEMGFFRSALERLVSFKKDVSLSKAKDLK